MRTAMWTMLFCLIFLFLCFGGGWTGVSRHLLDLSSLFEGVGGLRISRICVARPPLKRGRNYFSHGLLHGKEDFWVSWMIPLEFLVLAKISAGQGLGRCRGQEKEGIRRRMRKGIKYTCAKFNSPHGQAKACLFLLSSSRPLNRAFWSILPSFVIRDCRRECPPPAVG